MDLIYKQASLDLIKKYFCSTCNNYNGIRCRACCVDDTIELIENTPTVEAVVLPCKVGDTVWIVEHERVHEAKVSCIRPFIFQNHVEYRGNAVITIEDPFYADGRLLEYEQFIVFGKDTFLSKEEAEAKIKEESNCEST